MAVVLAAGLGTRMRAADGTALDAAQAAAAAAGLKALMPVADSRPFLDYLLSSLADAGLSDVCIVVAANESAIRRRYARDVVASRLTIHFAVQDAPRGTADAVLTCEATVRGSPFLVLNSDNYYPVDGLRSLVDASEPATLAFSRDGLLRGAMIPPDRIARYALLDIDAHGYLTDVIEKPDELTLAERIAAPISMNVWRFDDEIFRACREVRPSARGEVELPMAVQLALHAHHLRVRSIPIDATVLDLSHRADVGRVAERLRGTRVEL